MSVIKQKSFAPILILVLIALGVIGYLGYKHYQPTVPRVTFSPTPTSTSPNNEVFCKDPRPRVCTMECAQPPPYICGSDGKSYCSVCQACSNKGVTWYEMKAFACGEGQFCGGIAGALCPEGYSCTYDGDYPDAGGVCTKN